MANSHLTPKLHKKELTCSHIPVWILSV